MSLFELIDLIEDDLNFESAVKVLMLSEHNNFVKVYHIHRNARVFNEILIRLINKEDNQDKMIKMFKCLNNILEGFGLDEKKRELDKLFYERKNENQEDDTI